MKDFLAFLSLYPLWVKLTILVALGLCAALLLLFKPETKQPSPSEEPSLAKMTVEGHQLGQMAGRDIVNNAPIGASPAELVNILQFRARQIHETLGSSFQYTELAEFLSKFDVLHAQHIAALERNNLVEAHEYLRQIHSLSVSLESSEFWARHHAETPHVVYSLSDEAFQRGRLIKAYAGIEASSLLVVRPMEVIRERLQALEGRRIPAHSKPSVPELYAAIVRSPDQLAG